MIELEFDTENPQLWSCFPVASAGKFAGPFRSLFTLAERIFMAQKIQIIRFIVFLVQQWLAYFMSLVKTNYIQTISAAQSY